MKVSVVCVGKIKEKYFSDAIKEYSKRLRRFCGLDITEVPDERIPDNASAKDAEMIKQKEGERVLAKIKPNSTVIALCVEGDCLSSEDLADVLSDAALRFGSVVFVIGGSLGLSDAVKARADLRLSFGRMTFPHRLMRVILTEQIYRAFMINSGAKYHK